MGQNPGTNHPRMLTALEKAKKNGAKIIAINPLHEAGLSAFKDPQTVKGFLGIGVKLADLYLQVNINGDMALLKAIEKLLLDAEKENPGEVFDQKFIKSDTVGYEELVKHLEKQDVNKLCEAAGVPVV